MTALAEKGVGGAEGALEGNRESGRGRWVQSGGPCPGTAQFSPCRCCEQEAEAGTKSSETPPCPASRLYTGERPAPPRDPRAPPYARGTTTYGWCGTSRWRSLQV